MSYRQLIRVLVIGLTLAGLALPAAPRTLAAPSADPLIVDTTADLIDADTSDGLCLPGICSLRAAIMQANLITGPGITIILPAGIYKLARPATGGDGADSGDLNLTAPAPPGGNPVITIAGAGAAATIIDADHRYRIFNIAAESSAAISGVTIRNGYVASGVRGGGIWNLGQLTLSDSTLSGNRAFGGGGIYNDGTLTVTHSLFSGNLLSADGGGLSNSGVATVTDSTFSGNTATNTGGAIFNIGTLYLHRSTLSGNSSNFGGGIYTFGTVYMTNSTLTHNSANTSGGGVYDDGSGVANVYNSSIVFNAADADLDVNGNGGGIATNSVFNLRNSLVAGNNSGNSPLSDECYGTLHSYVRNLIGTDADPANCTVTVETGSVGTLDSLAGLGPLQNNGGPTWTHALLLGTNAIDWGSGCVDYVSIPLATDQRGFARIGGASCDIGAFEYYKLGPFLPLITR